LIQSNVSKPALNPTDDTSFVSISSNITTIESTLPTGWEHTFGMCNRVDLQFRSFSFYYLDQEGTIYYFNESTGESRWDKPEEEENDNFSPLPQRDDSTDTFIQGLNSNELQKLVYTVTTLIIIFYIKTVLIGIR
jgi:hypothetical protein